MGYGVAMLKQCYTHLSAEDRETLSLGLTHGHSLRTPAHAIRSRHALRPVPLADFFGILLDGPFPGRGTRMVVDQFLMCGKVIGFNGEVLLGKRFRAGRGTEVGTIRFSLLLRGEPAQPIFRHSG